MLKDGQADAQKQKSYIKMLKVELFYWAMGVNWCSPVGLERCRGVGHLSFYLPRVLFDCLVFLPRKFATHEEKMQMFVG